MAFDAALAERIRKQLGKRTGLAEKQMFGGLAFLLNGNMCVGVHGSEMIVRVDPGETDKMLQGKHVRLFDLTGRPMKGWLLIASAGVATAAGVGKWVKAAVAYAGALPKKR